MCARTMFMFVNINMQLSYTVVLKGYQMIWDSFG